MKENGNLRAALSTTDVIEVSMTFKLSVPFFVRPFYRSDSYDLCTYLSNHLTTYLSLHILRHPNLIFSFQLKMNSKQCLIK